MRKLFTMDGSRVVPIVADGAISNAEIGDGRFIPVLVLNCAAHQNVRDAIYAHEDALPGDIDINWVWGRIQTSSVWLCFRWRRPVQIDFCLMFDTLKQGILVDGIIHARGVYLQPSESGASVTEGMDKGKILAEVPDTEFLDTWTYIYRKRLSKHGRKNGLSRSEAKQAAAGLIEQGREMWRMRRPLSV